MDKAVEHAQSRYNMRSASKGNYLISSFSYSRLTQDEVMELFRAHNINLGCGKLDSTHIITALQ